MHWERQAAADVIMRKPPLSSSPCSLLHVGEGAEAEWGGSRSPDSWARAGHCVKRGVGSAQPKTPVAYAHHRSNAVTGISIVYPSFLPAFILLPVAASDSSRGGSAQLAAPPLSSPALPHALPARTCHAVKHAVRMPAAKGRCICSQVKAASNQSRHVERHDAQGLATSIRSLAPLPALTLPLLCANMSQRIPQRRSTMCERFYLPGSNSASHYSSPSCTYESAYIDT